MEARRELLPFVRGGKAEWEQGQVKITALGLMLLPIKPVGILPNFLQQQDPDTHMHTLFFPLKEVLGYISSPVTTSTTTYVQASPSI